jgi:hypothetical protein
MTGRPIPLSENGPVPGTERRAPARRYIVVTIAVRMTG